MNSQWGSRKTPQLNTLEEKEEKMVVAVVVVDMEEVEVEEREVEEEGSRMVGIRGVQASPVMAIAGHRELHGYTTH